MPRTKHDEALFQFLGAYFHQDWPDEHDTADEVVDAWLQAAAPGTVHLVTRALQDLAASTPDQDLPAALEERGCFYHPPGDDLTHRAWLEHLLERLRAHGA